MGEPEFSEPKSSNPRADHAAATAPDTNEHAQHDENTETGQEARRGVPPDDCEHESDGGGPKGGA